MSCLQRERKQNQIFLKECMDRACHSNCISPSNYLSSPSQDIKGQPFLDEAVLSTGDIHDDAHHRNLPANLFLATLRIFLNGTSGLSGTQLLSAAAV